MNIIVFGATGSVGKEIVKQGLSDGHLITAFVRNPSEFLKLENKNLKIYEGDVLDLDDVKKAMFNQDAVLCAIGDGRIGKIRSAGTKNILVAMKDVGVNRLICQSTIGAGDSYENLNFVWKYIMFGFLLKKVLPDHNLQERYIQQSSVDYTIVRPSALADGEITNNYMVGFRKGTKKLKLKINRSDVAYFMLQQLKSSEYSRKAVSISN